MRTLRSDAGRHPSPRRRHCLSRFARGSGHPQNRGGCGGRRNPHGLQSRLLEIRGKLFGRPPSRPSAPCLKAPTAPLVTSDVALLAPGRTAARGCARRWSVSLRRSMAMVIAASAQEKRARLTWAKRLSTTAFLQMQSRHEVQDRSTDDFGAMDFVAPQEFLAEPDQNRSALIVGTDRRKTAGLGRCENLRYFTRLHWQTERSLRKARACEEIWAMGPNNRVCASPEDSAVEAGNQSG